MHLLNENMWHSKEYPKTGKSVRN